MAAMEQTLMDVNMAIAAREEGTFRNVRCFLVNYTATCEWPHKFYYNGCICTKSNGHFCARASCGHEKKITRPMYRFQLQVTDCSPSPPVTVTIFEQARVLTGLSAEEFASYPAENQREMIREATSGGEILDLYLKVKEDSYSGEYVCIVQNLDRVHRAHQYLEGEDEVVPQMTAHILPIGMRTPSTSPGDFRKSPGECHTPRGSYDGSATGLGSSSRSVGRSNRLSKLSAFRSKFQDLEKVFIDLTTEEE